MITRSGWFLAHEREEKGEAWAQFVLRPTLVMRKKLCYRASRHGFNGTSCRARATRGTTCVGIIHSPMLILEILRSVAFLPMLDAFGCPYFSRL